MRADVREGQNYESRCERGAKTGRAELKKRVELYRQMEEGAAVRKRKCERGENVREGQM